MNMTEEMGIDPAVDLVAYWCNDKYWKEAWEEYETELRWRILTEKLLECHQKIRKNAPKTPYPYRIPIAE